jgi:hypothetical protein
MEVNMQTTMKGPFFKKGMKLTKEFAIDISKKLIEMGEERLASTLRPQGNTEVTGNPDDFSGVFKTKATAGRHASTGHYRRSINSQMDGAIGRITDSRVIYGTWLEGLSSRNNTSRFKGYFQFRITSEYMKKNTNKAYVDILPKYMRKINGV